MLYSNSLLDIATWRGLGIPEIIDWAKGETRPSHQSLQPLDRGDMLTLEDCEITRLAARSIDIAELETFGYQLEVLKSPR